MQTGKLIIAIVNKGNSDLVMDAARLAGATGGTILNAHGTTNEENSKFFGVPYFPEKDIVLIIVNNKISDDVLSKIYNVAGLKSKATGFIFSIDINNILGININNEKNN